MVNNTNTKIVLAIVVAFAIIYSSIVYASATKIQLPSIIITITKRTTSTLHTTTTERHTTSTLHTTTTTKSTTSTLHTTTSTLNTTTSTKPTTTVNTTITTSTSTFTTTIPHYYSLNMVAVPSNDGVLTPSAGNHTYLQGTLVTISEVPAGNHTFVSWNGYGIYNYTGTNSTAYVYIAGNITEVANFR